MPVIAFAAISSSATPSALPSLLHGVSQEPVAVTLQVKSNPNVHSKSSFSAQFCGNTNAFDSSCSSHATAYVQQGNTASISPPQEDATSHIFRIVQHYYNTENWSPPTVINDAANTCHFTTKLKQLDNGATYDTLHTSIANMTITLTPENQNGQPVYIATCSPAIS